MKRLSFLRHAMVWTAAVGFCLPMASAIGAEPVQKNSTAKKVSTAKKKNNPAKAIVDVALQANDELTGTVTDAQGRAKAGTVVIVRQNALEIARTTTDAKGQYKIQGMRGGVYQVTAGHGSRICRVWAAKTAPPVAQSGLLVVSDANAVLAQSQPGTIDHFFEGVRSTFANPIVMGAVIATAVAIPVAVHNSNSNSSS